jgi:uncharacterized protein
VGYGLEPILTDALSEVILQNAVLPKFRSGDYDSGVEAGVDALIQQLSLNTSEAEAKAAAAEQQAQQDSGPGNGQGGGFPALLIFLFIGFAIFRVFGAWGFLPFLFMGGGGRYGGGFGGGGFGGGGFGGGGGGFGGGGASGSW